MDGKKSKFKTRKGTSALHSGKEIKGLSSQEENQAEKSRDLKNFEKGRHVFIYGTNHVLGIRKKGVLADSRVICELLLKRMSRLQGSLLNGDSHLPSCCRERRAPSQKSV